MATSLRERKNIIPVAGIFGLAEILSSPTEFLTIIFMFIFTAERNVNSFHENEWKLCFPITFYHALNGEFTLGWNWNRLDILLPPMIDAVKTAHYVKQFAIHSVSHVFCSIESFQWIGAPNSNDSKMRLCGESPIKPQRIAKIDFFVPTAAFSRQFLQIVYRARVLCSRILERLSSMRTLRWAPRNFWNTFRQYSFCL